MPVNSAQVPDYYTIVTQPMDLGKIQVRLNGDHYTSPKDFCEVCSPSVCVVCRLCSGLLQLLLV